MFLAGSLRNTAQRPWENEDATQRMIMLSSNQKATIWCPTLAEQDARWWSVFGHVVEQQRQSVIDLTSTRARYEHHTIAKARTAATADAES